MLSLGRRAILENTYNIRGCRILHASKPLDLLRTHPTYSECFLTHVPVLVSAPHFRSAFAASRTVTRILDSDRVASRRGMLP
jgi:hypothetical protein